MKGLYGKGWLHDALDKRDKVLVPTPGMDLPPSLSLRDKMPPVYDQGHLGSCTANAIAAALEYEQMLQQEPSPFVPSRLFIYYNERDMEGTIASDSGAQIRDGIKSVASIGACSELDWPYNTNRFALRPPVQAYTDAPLGKALAYFSVPPDLYAMKCVLFGQRPIVIGFSVYESFESADVARSGVVPMPNENAEQLLGGHAVLVVGYDDPTHRFLVRNSWGAGWSQGGYFTMPYLYLLDPFLADDFWTVTVVA